VITQETIADRVREIRIACFGDDGIPVLAALMGLPERTWQNYESGVRMPAEAVLMLIELTGASPTYLLHGRGPRHSTAGALRSWR
jgi:DNA-binding transcriptional regulator YiaG